MIQNQVYVFLWSIFTGALLAFIFDLFRVVRRRGKSSVLIVCIQDVLYFLIVAFIIIMSSFITNDGELRGYMFFGYALGIMFYLLLFSKLVVKVLSLVFDMLGKAIDKCLTIPKKLLKKINFRRKTLQNDKT